MNIYGRISDWLKECPEIGSYVYFNVIPLEPDTSSVTSNAASTILNTYLDGSKEVHLLFNINLVQEYDAGGTSDLNLEAINAFDNITRFVEMKNNAGEYPDLDNYVVNEIGSTYKAPEVYITENNTQVARYEGQFYIEYLERKGD